MEKENELRKGDGEAPGGKFSRGRGKSWHEGDKEEAAKKGHCVWVVTGVGGGGRDRLEGAGPGEGFKAIQRTGGSQ